MPITKRITPFNKRFLNPLTIRLAGHGSIVDLEHVGRTSGRTFHTPLMAFRRGEAVIIALTYGPDVQWLKNVTAAGGCRMRIGGEWLTLGAPRHLDPQTALPQTPDPQRFLLRHVIKCSDFVQLPIKRATATS